MRRPSRGKLIILAGVFAAGCGSSTALDTPSPTPTPTTTSEITTPGSITPEMPPGTGASTPKATRKPTAKPAKPGVPGAPLTYDPTILGTGYDVAIADITEKLKAQCGENICGVKFVQKTEGDGKCVKELYPEPVYPGGEIYVVLGAPCRDDGDGDPPPSEGSPTATTTGP